VSDDTEQRVEDTLERVEVTQRFYIDCEFDGHNGPLLSLAIVAEDGRSIHIEVAARAVDPWVLANVVPLMDQHDATDCTRVAPNQVGAMIRRFLEGCEQPVIVADSPVDIGRFCRALSTSDDGGWASADFPRMTFEVYNVDCYPTDLPGAIQHNAWWDAMALRRCLAHERRPSPEVSEERALIDALCDFALGRVNLSMTAELRARIEALHTRAHPDTPAASSVDASGAVEAIIAGASDAIGACQLALLDGRPSARRQFASDWLETAKGRVAAAIRALPLPQPKDSDQ
jgi:hypothetical protein